METKEGRTRIKSKMIQLRVASAGRTRGSLQKKVGYGRASSAEMLGHRLPQEDEKITRQRKSKKGRPQSDNWERAEYDAPMQSFGSVLDAWLLTLPLTSRDFDVDWFSSAWVTRCSFASPRKEENHEQDTATMHSTSIATRWRPVARNDIFVEKRWQVHIDHRDQHALGVRL